MFKKNRVIAFLGSFAAITVFFASSVWAIVDISEIPLDAQTKAAPANIMFILDDSGSMDWEIMTTEPSGLFGNYEYIFDDPNYDNAFGSGEYYGTILADSVRNQWKSQWFEYNKMYYDPAVTYKPWPTLPKANLNNPRSHPYENATHTFDLSGSYYDGTLSGGGTLHIPRSHYYVRPDGSPTPYLVTMDSSSSSVKYYSTTVSGSGSTEYVTTYTPYTPVANPPDGVLSPHDGYTKNRQNFANWYSFYRRRQFTATAAVSNVISQMAGVQIGISTIQDRINQSVMSVKVNGVTDETNDLLNILYDDYTSYGGTPLGYGLQDVGQYYHQYDNHSGGIGTCPFWTAAKGGACQQAFAILMTDGYYNGGTPTVGNVDGDYGGLFADIYSNTLADIAMQYWKTDLSTELDNLIIPSVVDPATYQHMVTYGISFGVTGTLDPETHNPATTPWPDPEENSNSTIPEKIDDLYHASFNGHGTFLSASNPTDLVNSMLSIMHNIKQRIGSASSVSVNGDELYKRIDDNTYMFQSSYNTTGWVGDIKAFKIFFGDLNEKDGSISDPVWLASTVWNAYDWEAYYDERPIVTYDGSDGVRFRFGSLSLTQQQLLDSDFDINDVDSSLDPTEDPAFATARLILDYIRGDNSNEIHSVGEITTGDFRVRSTQLGDIIHSSPVYHDGVLYVGANDGMMHAIKAEGADAGKELFSYVPSQVIKNLHFLTNPTYSHHYYVDLTVSIKDEVLGDDSTLLVGGLGQGGIGYYALDVSNISELSTAAAAAAASAVPSEYDVSLDEDSITSTVLWEFPNTSTSDDDLADIGYSFSKSLIVETNDSDHPWVVIFGNGYNSASGRSALFVLDPGTGNVLNKILLGSDSDNGLSTPAVTDVDGDGKVDYAYAGDLAGNMWKIDLTDDDVDQWKVAFYHGTAPLVPDPLFKARGLVDDTTYTTQPITSKPDVMLHPQEHGYMVVFGTGKFLSSSDFSDETPQTVYGIWDYGDDVDNTENLGVFDPKTGQVSALTDDSTLLKQELLIPDFTYDLTPDDTTDDDATVRVLTDKSIHWVVETNSEGEEIDINGTGTLPDLSTSDDNNAGWYFDLPNSGERVVNRMMIRDGKAIFISFTPENAPCTPGGNSILHEVDAADGSRMATSVFDTNGDGVVNSADLITVTAKDESGNNINIKVAVTGIQREGQLQTPAILKLGNEEIKYMSSTSGGVETAVEAAAKTGVTSWRQF